MLDSVHYRTVYLPVGVGHAFVALEDQTIVSYLMSLSYTPSVEMALTVFGFLSANSSVNAHTFSGWSFHNCWVVTAVKPMPSSMGRSARGFSN